MTIEKTLLINNQKRLRTSVLFEKKAEKVKYFFNSIYRRLNIMLIPYRKSTRVVLPSCITRTSLICPPIKIQYFLLTTLLWRSFKEIWRSFTAVWRSFTAVWSSSSRSSVLFNLSSRLLRLILTNQMLWQLNQKAWSFYMHMWNGLAFLNSRHSKIW